MIITGAALLGPILTNRTSSGSPSATSAATKTAPAPPEPVARPEPVSAAAPVRMSLSTLDALFALQVPRRGGAPADMPARTPAPAWDADPGPQRTRARTTVDPDLVRAIAAALESRKGDGTGLTATGQRSAVSLETSISRQNSLWDALELAGRAQPSEAATGHAALR